ncbi:choice-of-anchor P family protein [Nocardioides sp. YIM 152315]|uniref:choice-of-anchor P family protein n=1 Tax=Nocardioides sp. YIM 152315 TaxID=3031760 RepID=UPI0023DB26F0|nr:choice-of-anchor P family protein [Nocardioides sp. YIM 152315]MDF1604920.1 choice-of-anchor P family protein [Nocardioides sp. YIM 152315]
MKPARIVVPLAAAAIAGALLPVSSAASAPTAATAEEKAAFSGYTAEAWAAPVKIEIYEPTIPIPADPQLEIELAYSTVEADSGSSKGRASWLWPGDPVGEGMKTFVEQLGLPPQLGENGYPVQVNAGQPSGEASQSDEPFPGAVMRTSAAGDTTIAQVGFSPDGAVGDGTEPTAQEGAEGAGVPPLPGAPGLPALPALPPGLGGLQEFGQAITGSLGLPDLLGPTASSAQQPVAPAQGAAADPATPAVPGLPPELATLVDVEGYTSSSKTVRTATGVVSTARSALGEVSLLGGLVELDGLVVTSVSSSDGTTGTPKGRARLGGMTVAGQQFGFGPDGLGATGRTTAIPAVPEQLTQALGQLGVRLELPAPELAQQKDKAESDLAGMRLELDLGTVLDRLDALRLDTVIGAIPSQAGQLKSLLQAVAGLSPRIVLTLGNAGSSVDTVQRIQIPTDLPTEEPVGDDEPAGSKGDAGGGAAPPGGAGSPPAAPGGAAATPASAGAPAAAGGATPAGDLRDAGLTGSGLPPLYSIPGAILVGGLALGALGGTWLRRAGVLALGGAGSCSHGLDRGLPDLRKAR